MQLLSKQKCVCLWCIDDIFLKTCQQNTFWKSDFLYQIVVCPQISLRVERHKSTGKVSSQLVTQNVLDPSTLGGRTEHLGRKALLACVVLRTSNMAVTVKILSCRATKLGSTPPCTKIIHSCSLQIQHRLECPKSTGKV